MVTLTINNITIVFPTENVGDLIPVIACWFGFLGWFFFFFSQLYGEDSSLAKVKGFCKATILDSLKIRYLHQSKPKIECETS